MKNILIIGMIFISYKVFACSPQQAKYVRLDANPLESSLEEPPAKPTVTVYKIYRGNSRNPLNSCSDTGMVILAIEPTGQEEYTAYEFKLVSGKADDVIFQSGLYQGYEDKETGKYLYSFPWVDGATKKQEPLDLEVEVTPYKLSGVKGKSTTIKVKDKGR